MRTGFRLCLAQLLLLPLASHAASVDIPELGVELPDVPSGITTARAVERPDGYEWQTQLGTSTLSIYREERPTPAGSNVSDRNYRATLDVKFHTPVKSQTTGSATAVGGQPAWTAVGSQRLGALPLVVSNWLTYVIVDDHLYRLAVSALAQGGRPSEFDSLVKAVSGVSFGPIRRTQTEPAASKAGDMPRFVSGGNQDFYPAKAKRLNEQGVVGVVFNIDGTGRVQRIKQLYADAPDLAAGAGDFLVDGVFRVPSNWEETAYDKQRFFMEFQFSIVAPGVACPQGKAPRESSAKVVTICTRPPGSVR